MTVYGVKNGLYLSFVLERVNAEIQRLKTNKKTRSGSAPGQEQEQKGVIVSHHGIAVNIRFESGEQRLVKVKRRAGHVVGDTVAVKHHRLTRLPRKTELCRRNSRGSICVVGANLDVLGVVVSPLPSPTPGYIDQSVIAARQAGLIPLLVINKADLETAGSFIRQMERTYSESLDIFVVSAKTGQGLDALKLYLRDGLRAIFTGITGVGKSSLLNAIFPTLDLKVGEIYEAGKRGCNTTTVSSLHSLPDGGELVDTPGFNEFGLVDITTENLAECFPGFEQVPHGSCRFRNCRHRTEPGCIVSTMVDSGQIPMERYTAYTEILNQIEAGDARFRTRR